MRRAEIECTPIDMLPLGGTLVDAGGLADIVVMFPGGGGVDRTEHGFYERVGTALADLGVSSLMCEHRAYLTAGDRESSSSVTLAGLTCDVLAACATAHGLSIGDLPHPRVHLLAASLTAGLATAAATSARLCAPVASVALLYPVMDYWEQMVVLNGFGSRDTLSDGAVEHLDASPGLVHRGYLHLRREMVLELFRWDARAHLERLSCPSLILHGSEDPVIPFATSARLCEGLDHVTLRTIDDRTHGFGRNPLGTPAGDALADEIILNYSTWLKGTLL